jgi:hypothetical protein
MKDKRASADWPAAIESGLTCCSDCSHRVKSEKGLVEWRGLDESILLIDVTAAAVAKPRRAALRGSAKRQPNGRVIYNRLFFVFNSLSRSSVQQHQFIALRVRARVSFYNVVYS